MRVFIAILLLALAALPLEARTTTRSRPGVRLRAHHPVRHRVRARRARPRNFWSPVKGSRESLLRQNQRLDQDELERIQDDDELAALVDQNKLVALEDTRAVRVAVVEERRWCRPWTLQFVEDLGEKHYEAFRRPVQVNSAVRTAEYQRELMRRNHNAAAEEGDLASPHLSGATVDISKRGLPKRELAWMRQYLLRLQNEGVIDAEEEFRQPVFHITVYKRYEDFRVARAGD